MIKIHVDKNKSICDTQGSGTMREITAETIMAVNSMYLEIKASDPQKADYFKTAMMEHLFITAPKKKAPKRKALKTMLVTAGIAALLAFSGYIGYSIGRTEKTPTAADLTPSIQSTIAATIIPEETTKTETDTLNETEDTYLGTFKLTAYCPCEKCCGEWADGITYTGTKATAGRTIAVDPDVIPLNSIVFIDGKSYIAEDIGGAIDGNRIDIYFDTHQEALEFGIQSANVTIAN